MKLYFAGSDANKIYDEVLRKAGAKNKLESFYFLKNKKDLEFADFNYLLDSGGFTARTRGTIISVQEYANFLNRHKIKNAFNLDTNDIEESLRNQDFLEKNTGCYIIPVYHHEESINKKYDGLLEKYVEKYPYIAIGGLVNSKMSGQQKVNFISRVFRKTKDKVKVHGLGITSIKFMEMFPFYSVDSTSWLGAARYGRLTNESLAVCKIKAKHFHYTVNTGQEVKHYLTVEEKITRLWERRGIKWD